MPYTAKEIKELNITGKKLEAITDAIKSLRVVPEDYKLKKGEVDASELIRFLSDIMKKMPP